MANTKKSEWVSRGTMGMQERIWVYLQEPFCGAKTQTLQYQNGHYIPATLADLTQRQGNVCLVFPAHWSVGCRLAIQRSQRKHLQKLLPFLLEEQLAWPLEQQHIVGEMITEHQANVWVMARTWIDACYRWMVEQKIPLSHAYTGLQALPRVTDKILLWSHHHQVWIAWPSGQRMVVEKAALLLMLPQWFTADTPVEIGVLASEATDASLIEGLRQQGISVTTQDYQSRTLPEFCLKNLRDNAPVENLLQGDFPPLARIQTTKWQAWRPLAGVGVFFLVAQMLFNMGQALWFDSHSNSVQQQMFAIYHRLYPNAGNPQHVRQSMQQRMQTAQAATPESRVLSLLARLSTVTGKLPQWGINVDHMDYDDTSGEITLTLTAKDYEPVNLWVAALSQSGLSATITSAVKTHHILTSTIVIKG